MDGEGAQIAAVDADEIEAEGDGAIHLVAVVNLAEDVEAHAAGFVAELGEGDVSVGRDDEENGVGAGCTRFEDLKSVEDEVLAQAGNFDDAGGLAEEGERALEELFVGEDGECGGAGGLEGAGEGCRIEVSADKALRGGGLLDFGDDGGAGSGAKGCSESSGGVGGRLLFELTDVRAEFASLDLEERVGKDLIELSGHSPCSFAQKATRYCLDESEADKSSLILPRRLPEVASNKRSCKTLVPKGGLEPPHPCEYMDLNHARLPIPPLRHGVYRSAQRAGAR